MKKYFSLLLVSAVFFSCSNPGNSYRKGKMDNLLDDTDVEMFMAGEKARQNLNEFDTAYVSSVKGIGNFAMKINTDGGKQVWLYNVIVNEQGIYMGEVSDSTGDSQFGGAVITIDSASVCDWMYLDGRKLRGGYSIRLQYNRMSEEEKKNFDKENVFIFDNTAVTTPGFPTGSEKFEGVLMSCKDDSSTIIVDTLIRLKKAISPENKSCVNCKYSDCSAKPEYFDFLIHWPGEINFNFKEMTYYFLTNPRPHHPNIKYGQKGFQVHYDIDGGTIKCNNKNKSMILHSDKYKVTRNFTYSYSLRDSVLTLRSAK
jgi:uncharacterized protein YegJ (DUF2314 family)